ncbi:MAG: NAD(P)H-dependent oxidoreductase [Flavobacteriaceae bacterium]|nr:NAD(P)H-dependent oxidoreductase [Flavobacteriaceae bacterium]
MNVIESLEWRYACKKFDEKKKLSTAQIDTLKKAFNLTATSFGLQPLKMLIVESQEILDKLAPHAFYQKQVTTCSHLLIICIDTEINSKTIDARFDLEKKIRGTSEDIVGDFRVQLKDMFAKKSEHEIEKSTIHQAYITLGNLMTVCAIEKIDACPMEGFLPEKFDEELHLKEQNLKSILLLPVGYRAQDDLMSAMKKVRKPLKETVISI